MGVMVGVAWVMEALVGGAWGAAVMGAGATGGGGCGGGGRGGLQQVGGVSQQHRHLGLVGSWLLLLLPACLCIWSAGIDAQLRCGSGQHACAACAACAGSRLCSWCVINV